MNLVSLIQLLLAIAPVLADRAGIDERDIMEEVEHVFVDNFGHNFDGLYNAVNPCSSSVDPTTEGEINGGQWIRLPFHDFVTADVNAGTGGLDASIGFESNRPENSGNFINESLNFFGPDINAFMSMADMITLGAIQSVNACGSKASSIDLRAGRVDATEAGPAGVPEPTTDLNTTLAQFAAAGFDQASTIALTACGHTVGHIHYSNFPDIVSADAVTDNNTEGAVGFDSTPIVFDNVLVTEYLSGNGSAGGLLVAGTNVSARSDFRLYNSDDNVTITALATESAFDTTCYALFEQMLNTVPSGVTLSPVITPMVWKGVGLIMDITVNGSVSLAGEIRNLYDGSTPVDTATYTYTSSNGNSSVLTSDVYNASTGAGSSQFGNTSYYTFNTTLDSPGTTEFTIEDEISYPINDELFILPNWSINNNTNGTITLYAAGLTSSVSSDLTGVLMVPTRQTGSVSSIIVNTTVAMETVGTAGNYTLFSGNATASGRGNSVVAVVYLGDGEVKSRPVKSDFFITIGGGPGGGGPPPPPPPTRL
jgi:hypothetical protein